MADDELHLLIDEDDDVEEDSDVEIDNEDDDQEHGDGSHFNIVADGRPGPPRQRDSYVGAIGRRQSHTEVTFNVQLPVAHSYLGEDLEELHGRTIHDDDSCQTIPIISLPGVILIPGQTLPLHIFPQTTVAMMKRLVESDKTFGLVCMSYSGPDTDYDELSKIGTTAEIFSYKEINDEQSGVSTMRMKATGRQRFEILETRRQMDGVLLAKVRILPEKHPTKMLEGACCRVHQVSNESSCFLKHKQRRLAAAYNTHWPPWLYENYDCECLMRTMKEELSSWNDTLDPSTMPSDPVDFSFWVAGNIMMDDMLKIRLLRIDCAVQRLRCELDIMRKCSVLCCKECEEMIFNNNDVFTMSIQGPMGTFVNPGGYVHEMFTVNNAQGLSLVGRPSTQHSWFPGYAWTIAQCRSCSSHMGWRFTVVNKKHGLKPERFWGICRSAVDPKLQQEHTADQPDEWEPCL